MIEGVGDRVGEATTECRLNMALSEHVYRASDGEVREAFGTDPNGLALIDEGLSRSLLNFG